MVAEEMLHALPLDVSGFSSDELQDILRNVQSHRSELLQLIHELQVNQMQLELQHEELIKTQAELTRVHDRYEQLFEFAPIGYLSIAEDGTIVEANMTASTLLGLAKETLLMTPFINLVAWEDQDICYFYQQRLLQTLTLQTCELRLQRANNAASTPFYVRLEGVCIIEGANQTPHYRIALSDITEHMQSLEALRQAYDIAELRMLERTTELRKYRDAQHILTRATRTLASDLDSATRLQHLAAVVVPFQADLCIIDRVRDDGQIENLVLAHHNAEQEQRIRTLLHNYPTTLQQTPANQVVGAQQTVYMQRVTEDALDEYALDAAHREQLLAFGFTSYIGTPLVAHGKVIGAFNLIMDRSGRTYEPGDVWITEQLASSVALALGSTMEQP
jgi:PAS domain S-box-containing protein